MQLGSNYLENGATQFLVWAPLHRKVDVHIVGPHELTVPLYKYSDGYFTGVFDNIGPGSRYYYLLDDQEEYPDPASHFQPEGVHGPSEIIEPNFNWSDADWRGIHLNHYLIYELHVGTCSTKGDFDGVIGLLDHLVNIGITALELMPVAQFPGNRNWGYDAVYPFSVQNSYGRPDDLKRLVNECHNKGLAVILDVVYNHLGPEGNYLEKFGPYFTDRYHTPWGKAVNFDGAFSDHVRRYFIENARYWINNYHIDALRLDALHAIFDSSPHPFLNELTASVDRLRGDWNKWVYLIGESDANDRKIILAPEAGGYGLDAQWNEGFHHALHTLLTDEKSGYYQDFGTSSQLAKAFREGFVYSGEYSAYRKRRHGSSSLDIPATRFIVFAQNHDQIGNRPFGERLSQLVSFDSLKLAAGVVLVSPYIPLIFMGEEYAELSPFQYFTSHSDPTLINSVRQGRLTEFANCDPENETPDPQSENTYERSKLNYNLIKVEKHHILQNYYRRLIDLRKHLPALSLLSKSNMQVLNYEALKTLYVRRWDEDSEIIALTYFGETDVSMTFPFPPGDWDKVIDSAESEWLGPGTYLPLRIDSKGEVTLVMKPKELALFKRSEGD